MTLEEEDEYIQHVLASRDAVVAADTTQAPWPRIDQSKLTLSNAYRSSYAEDDDFLHIER
jgi:hypothetical protein